MSKFIQAEKEIGVVFFVDGSVELGPVGVPPSTDYVRKDHHQAIISDLESRLQIAVEALEKYQCDCSVQDRLSGHLIGCQMVELEEALQKIKGETK